MASRWDRYTVLYLFFKLLLVTAALGGLFAVVVGAKSVFIPIGVAFFVAYQTNPLVDWAERRRVPRAVTTVVMLLAVIAGLTLFLALFLPKFFGEFKDMVHALPKYLDAVQASLVPWLQDELGLSLDLDVATLKAQLQEHGSALLRPTGDILGSLASGVLGLVGALLYLLLIPVFFFLSTGYHDIVATAGELVPHRHRALVARLAARIDRALSSFVRGQLIVTAFLAVFYSVGLALLGIKYAVFIGVIAGVANLIPYVGVALGASLAVLMALLEWSGWGAVVGVGGLFVAGNVTEAFVLTPKIVGDRVGLSPLLVLVGLLFWGELLGFVGVVIGIPLTAVLRIVLSEVLTHYKASEFFQQEGAPEEADSAAEAAEV